MQDIWEFYQDSANQWRWRRKNYYNHNIVGASSQGYANKSDCIANARIHGYTG